MLEGKEKNYTEESKMDAFLMKSRNETSRDDSS